MRLITIVILVYLPTTFVSVSLSSDDATPTDFSQYTDTLWDGHRKVPKSGWIQVGPWLLLIHSDDEVATSDASSNIRNGYGSVAHI